MTTTVQKIDTCNCGHTERIHNVLEGTDCRACACEAYRATESVQAAMEATERARQTSAARERAYNDLRRAVANWKFGEAKRILERLMASDG